MSTVIEVNTSANPAYVTIPDAAGGGTVTSVGLSMPGIFTVSNSPVTTTGTLTATLATQTANIVFAGPTSGGAATPTFRSLVVADLPTGIPNANLQNSSISVSAGSITTVSGSPVALGGTVTVGVDLTASPTWTGVHTFQQSNVLQAQTTAVTLKNNTAAAGGLTNQQQFSPALTFEGQGWGTTAGASGLVRVLLQAQPISAAVAQPQLNMYAQRQGDANPTAMAHFLFDVAGGISVLDSDVAALIVRNTVANGVVYIRGNPTDSGGNYAVRLAGAAGVTYTSARILSVDNPAGTAVAAVDPNGTYRGPGIDVMSAGALNLATGLATSVVIGAANVTGSTTIKNAGAAAASLVVDSTANFSNGQNMLELRSAGVLQGALRYGTGGSYPQFVSNSTAMAMFNSNADGVSTGNNIVNFLIGGTNVARLNTNSQFEFQRAVLYHRTAVADTAYAVGAADQNVQYSTLTATRAVTLPLATTGAGRVVIVQDFAGTAATNNITFTASGSDTINGLTTINSNYGTRTFISDGTSKWVGF